MLNINHKHIKELIFETEMEAKKLERTGRA